MSCLNSSGVSAVLFILAAICSTNQLKAELPDISKLDIYAALKSTVRSIRNVRVSGVIRSSNGVLEDTTVRFVDVWLRGDECQFQVSDITNSINGDDWRGVKIPMRTDPLGPSDLAETNGVVGCCRQSGGYVWAESRLSEDPSRGFDVLYNTSRRLRPPQVIDLPLVQLNRAWVPEEYSSTAFAPEVICGIPLEKWSEPILVELEGSECYFVRIRHLRTEHFPLKGHDEPLAVNQTWDAWFSTVPTEKFSPVRIIRNAEFSFKNALIPYRMAGRIPSLLEYRASTFLIDDRGNILPETGYECRYGLKDPLRDAFDPNKVVEHFLQTGEFVDETEFKLQSNREWKLSVVSDCPHDAKLWIDPPYRSGVLDADTKLLSIHGVSKEESENLLNGPEDVPVAAVNNGQKYFWTASIFLLVAILSRFAYLKINPRHT